MDYRKIYAIQKQNEERILKVNSEVTHASGIYIFFRTDEIGIKHAYVGQAKDLLNRLAQHLNGYNQHIDRSLKKHRLYNENENPYGYRIKVYEFPIEELDEKERFYIKQCANYGYQLKNITAGGQDKGKVNINEQQTSKTYRDGVEYGKKKMKAEVKAYFKYLEVSPKQYNKLCERKLKEFKEEFLEE